MNSLIVGGTFGEGSKPSSVVTLLAKSLSIQNVINGGTVDDLKNVDLSDKDFVLWMPNVSNSEEKFYPRKKRGCFLVCSKVMRPEYGWDVPISRIFKMRANAVIAIESDKKPFTFHLIDALGNTWVSTNEIGKLAESLLKMYEWSNSQIRIKSTQMSLDAPVFENQDFIDLVKLTADKIDASNVGRFFGNASTRCFKTFPSMRSEFTSDVIYVSARDVDKQCITVSDMVKVRKVVHSPESSEILYSGGKQPSVDTPVQLSLYESFWPDLNFMIHGHAYILNAFETKNYFPCGDMREVKEIKNTLAPLGWLTNKFGVVNLKYHGFLIYADTLPNLADMIKQSMFVQNKLGPGNMEQL